MNDLALSGPRKADKMTLEELLDALGTRGHPRLSRLDDGTWFCRVKMFVSAQGADFEVQSDFKQPTHIHATRQCYERMTQALKQLGVNP